MLYSSEKLTVYHRFVHGGVINDVYGSQTENSDQMYILSIPSFRWFHANYTSTYSRAGHSCQATNSSQMILIGGLDPTYSVHIVGDSPQKDPWRQGIGVFDMTALEFKNSYQANAGPYKTQDVIRKIYNTT